MAPKKKVVKLDPIHEVIPDPAPAPTDEIVEAPTQAPVPDDPVPVDADNLEDALDAALGGDDALDGDDMLDDMLDEDDMLDGDMLDGDMHATDLFDVMSGLFVARDGDTITDVLVTISDALDTHNKLMYKLIKVLESKK